MVASHPEKVKLTFECSTDDRAYIKMLAARARMTLGEFVMSYLRKDFPQQLNTETKQALTDSRNRENLEHAKTVQEFWKQMGINPDA